MQINKNDHVKIFKDDNEYSFQFVKYDNLSTSETNTVIIVFFLYAFANLN